MVLVVLGALVVPGETQEGTASYLLLSTQCMQEVRYCMCEIYLAGSVFLSTQHVILTILAVFTVLKNTLLSLVVIFPSRITVFQLRPNEISNQNLCLWILT